MYDALTTARSVKERDSRTRKIALNRDKHLFSHPISIRTIHQRCGNDVVNSRECSVGIPNRQSTLGKHLKGLRACNFVNQMKSNKELRLSIRKLPHSVRVPNFVQQCPSHASS
jgi:hypothetical protein